MGRMRYPALIAPGLPAIFGGSPWQEVAPDVEDQGREAGK